MKLRLFISIIIIIILSFGSIISSFKLKDNSLSTYKLKYITQYTHFPVKLLDHFGTYETTNAVLSTTRWYKYGSMKYVDQLNNETDNGQYFATEINDVNGAINLFLLDYDKKEHFLIDHYEPRHQHADLYSTNLNNELIEHMKKYVTASNPMKKDDSYDERELYTLVYLKNFELDVKEKNKDEFELKCKINLLIPNGISDEHSVIINDELSETSILTLKLHHEANGDDNAKHSRKKHNNKNNKKNTITRLIKRSLDEKNGDDSNKQQLPNKQGVFVSNKIISDRSANLYEIEMMEGPILINRKNFQNKFINVSCHLKLIDFDATHAFDHYLNKTNVFNVKTTQLLNSNNNNDGPIRDNVMANTENSGTVSINSSSFKYFYLTISILALIIYFD